MTPQNGLLIFLGKETHSETKSWKSSRILTNKNYNDNGKPWKSSRILRVNPNFLIFLSLFNIFLHFSHFFIFHFFILFHFISFSVMFFVFLFLFLFLFLFFFFLFLFLFVGGAQILIFFLGFNFVTISFHISYKKNFFGPSRGVPL